MASFLKSGVVLGSLLAAVSLLGWAPGRAVGQEVAVAAEAEARQASQGLVAAYVAAFNKGDAAALAGLYGEDARYAKDGGKAFSGRAEIAAALSAFFQSQAGATLAVEVTEARLLTPEVLLEKGLATVQRAEAAGPETTRYAATYVKRGGAWLISDLDETVLLSSDEGAGSLAALDWLVGQWKDEGEGTKVETKVSWTLNRHFLRRSFAVARPAEGLLEGTEVIGYDAAAGALRSWTFDSEGGMAEGTWRQEGNKWLVLVKATLADGGLASSENVLTRVEDGKYTWESINRSVNGQPLPNSEPIAVVRAAAE